AGAEKACCAPAPASASKSMHPAIQGLARILTFQRKKLQGEASRNSLFARSQLDIGNALEALNILDSANVFCNGTIASLDIYFETKTAQFLGLGRTSCSWSRCWVFRACVMGCQFRLLGRRVKILKKRCRVSFCREQPAKSIHFQGSCLDLRLLISTGADFGLQTPVG